MTSTARAPAKDRIRGQILPWLPVILGPVLLLGTDLIRGRALFWGTPLLQFTPWRTAAKELVLSGHLPLWNSALGMGAPLLANYQSALLYPPNWSLLALDVAWGQTLLVLLHLIWAGAGMAVLARLLGVGRFGQTVAGLAYGMSGYLVSRSGFLSINAAAAWLPWVLAASELLLTRRTGRRLALLGLVLALQWLAGHAQIAWYTLLLAGAWVLYRARAHAGWPAARGALLALLGAAALAFLIAGAQLIPTMEYVSVSNRASDLDPEFVLTYSFWPWRVLGLVTPDLYGSPATGDFWGYGNYWEDAVYIGVLPLLLAIGALASRDTRTLKWFLLAIGLIGLLLALGKNTPVFSFLYENVPTFALFQAPTRWNLWLVFSLALLAGLGADRWMVAQGRTLYWLRLGTAGAAAIVLIAALGAVSETGIEPTFARSFLLAGVWLLVAGVLALLRRDPRSLTWTAAVVGVILFDLLFAGRGLNPTQPAELNSAPSALRLQVTNAHRLYIPSQLERQIKFDLAFRFDSFQPDFDWSTVRESGLPNTTLLDHLDSSNNFDPLLPDRYVAWMAALEQAGTARRESLLGFMDVGWQALPAGPGGVRYVPNERPLRAWIAPRSEWVTTSSDAIKLTTSPGFDPLGSAVLEGGPHLDQSIRGGSGSIEEIRDIGPHRVELLVDAPQGGWLVLADTWYPGWEAQINGEPVSSYPAYGIFRSIYLPAGRHSVSFSYRPITVPIGLGLTAVGVLAAAILLRR